MYTYKIGNFTEYEVDALIFPLFLEENKAYSSLNKAFSGELTSLRETRDLCAKAGKVTKLVTFNKIAAKKIYFVGLWIAESVTKESLRKAFGKVFKQLSQDKVTNAALVKDALTHLNLSENDLYEAIGEAHALAPFVFTTHHTKDKKTQPEITELTIVSDTIQDEDSILQALQMGYTLGEGANLTRHLVNIPGNYLTATDLAEFAEGLAATHQFEIDIVEKDEMESLNMGALLAVNQGSNEPPKLIVIRYQGKESWDAPLTLVGKGITFDTGGYSLKTKDGIVGMKTDMGGAAAVLGAMDVIGTMKPKVNVMAVIPATDNMISGKAFRPDDVIVSMSGKTIEVRNTDAEGRLVLADAVTYAKTKGAAKIIDIATLTGGVIIALGNEVTGAMTNDESWYKSVKEGSEQTGELIWQLPYFDLYKKQIRNSHIADLNNSPGRAAQSITAGAFVGEFAEDTPWVHLDIAGTATIDSPHDLGPKGATGVMARTLAKVILNEEKSYK